MENTKKNIILAAGILLLIFGSVFVQRFATSDSRTAKARMVDAAHGITADIADSATSIMARNPDAPEADWYSPGIAWALETGVSDGSKLDEPLTKREAIILLYRVNFLLAEKND
jgi:hypothetical protein